MTLTARWALIDYPITYLLDGGTNAPENPVSFNMETPAVQLAAPEKPGYAFSGWFEGETRITELSPGSARELTLTARWEMDLDSTPFLFDTTEGITVTGLKDETATSVVIPDYVTAIADYAFLTNFELTSVVFAPGSHCEVIGAYAFEYCSSLTSLDLPASIREIRNAAFYLCGGLTEVTFEKGSALTSLGEAAFSDCSMLSGIELPATLKALGTGVFNGCTSLSRLTFESGSMLETVGDYAFSYTALTDFRLPASVQTLGEGVFMMCTSLTSLTFGEDSRLESIGTHAFSYCSSLRSVQIPGTVTRIGASESYTLSELYFGGSQDRLPDVTGLEDFVTDGTTVFFYSADPPTAAGNYWHFEDGVIVTW